MINDAIHIYKLYLEKFTYKTKCVMGILHLDIFINDRVHNFITLLIMINMFVLFYE